ncbi:MAG TPA: hypothetical protein VG847_07705 [Chitinophagaceae bacterium]|nr:hypothetical protein [Chitinophagaceae bacterium]
MTLLIPGIRFFEIEELKSFAEKRRLPGENLHGLSGMHCIFVSGKRQKIRRYRNNEKQLLYNITSGFTLVIEKVLPVLGVFFCAPAR